MEDQEIKNWIRNRLAYLKKTIHTLERDLDHRKREFAIIEELNKRIK